LTRVMMAPISRQRGRLPILPGTPSCGARTGGGHSMGEYNPEEAWLNGPWWVTWMLHDLGKLPAATERKLRLFAVACCRRVRGHFSDFHWQLVELSERLAEGETSQDELRELTALIAEAGFHSSGFDACMAASGMGKALWDDPAPAAYTPDDADLVAQWCASY